MDAIVYVADVEAARLTRGLGGQIGCTYAPGYEGPPLGMTLPVARGTHDAGTWLDGLIPAAPGARWGLAQQVGVSPDDLLALAAVYGLDSPGHVRIESVSGDSPSLESGKRIESRQFAQMVAEVAGGGYPRVQRSRSLVPGRRPVWALERVGEGWRWPATRSTHLVRPEPQKQPGMADAEEVALRIAELAGIPAVEAWVETAEDGNFPVLAFERWDGEDASTVETLAQAMGREFSELRGVPAAEVVATLAPHGLEWDFLARLAFQVAIGGSEADLGTYQIVTREDSTRYMAPVDDALPTPLTGYERPLPITVGRAEHLDGVDTESWRVLADEAGLDPTRVESTVREVNHEVLDWLNLFPQTYAWQARGVATLRRRLERWIG